MTDRELLELAAKAVGMPAEAVPDNLADDVPWNPLVDDGDALRLAVKLGLCIERDAYLHVEVRDYTGRYLDGPRWITEDILPDSFVATRRAIVRAAAEIGKAMP